jgi:hypothetical protein
MRVRLGADVQLHKASAVDSRRYLCGTNAAPSSAMNTL